MDAGLANYYSRLEQARGLPAGFLSKTYGIESNYGTNTNNPANPNVQGGFQFSPGTAKQVGLTNPNDPYEAGRAAADYAVQNRPTLQKVLGRDPTGGELYLAHQQGPGGAAALLSHPDQPAALLLGQKAVVDNGGSADIAARDFASKWTGKFDGVGNSPPADAQAAPTPMPPPVSGGIGSDARAQAPTGASTASLALPPPPPSNIQQIFDTSSPGSSILGNAQSYAQSGQGSQAISALAKLGQPSAAASTESPFPAMTPEAEHMPDLTLMSLLQKKRGIMGM